MCRSNADVWHFKRTVATHILRISLCIRLSFNLDTTCPVIFCNGRITFHNIAIGINTTIYFMIQFASSCFGFQDAMPHRSIFRSGRSRFIIVVDHIEHSSIIATVRRTMYPVEHYTVYKIENTIPTDGRITSRITCPQVTHKCTILTP